MITKCFKCNSMDIVDVDGVLMCNNCGEILNANTKKDITINIDEIKFPKDDSYDDDEGDDNDLDLDNLDDILVETILEDDDFEDDDTFDAIEEFKVLQETLNYPEEFDEFNKTNDDIMDQEGNWCYIDDVDGLNEDLNYDDYNGEFEEKYPGLLVTKKNKI